ncbi:MAG: cytochrome c [Desulfobaccales bacterium]
MKKLILWSIVGLGVVSGLWWSPGTALAQEGQSIYKDKCAMCHGRDGKGNGPLSSVFSPSPADFTSASFWQKTSNAKITDTIENGHGPMPSFELSPGQIRAVISYMTQTFKPGS